MILAEYFQSLFLAKRDCGAREVQTPTIGGKMLPCKRSPSKKWGRRAYQVRSLERFVDSIFFALLQRF